MKSKRKKILSALFDVRPIKSDGDLDMAKIQQTHRILDLRGLKSNEEENRRERALRLEALNKKANWDFGSEGANQLVMDRLEADFGITGLSISDLREKVEKTPEPEEEIVEEPEEEIVEEQPVVSQEVLAQMEADFADEPVVEEVKEEPIEKPTLVSDRLPTKEELLAELEEIDKTESMEGVLNHQQFVASKEDLNDEPAKEPTELEKIYLQEDAPEYNFQEALEDDVQEEIPLPQQMRPPVYAGPEWSQPEAVSPNRSLFSFILTGILIALIIPGATLLSRGISIKNMVLGNGMEAIQNLLVAKESMEATDWQTAEQSFGLAHQNFLQASQEVNQLGQVAVSILEHLPGGSLVSSGNHLIKVGEHLAEVGQKLSSVAGMFSIDNWFNSINLSGESFLTELLSSSKKDLKQILEGIRAANQELDEVKVSSLPEDIRDKVKMLKEKLPVVEDLLESASVYSEALLEIMGHSNPKQYLLVFQNNSEMRATGGFVGTYGLLKLYQGQIRELFIDGVFNADGQLHEKIIPPKPIQKISTAWSMHDANWFADFPTSADKIAWFYEKTGGPTVDGVISFTPVLIERLLDLTGPITMPEYDVVLDADNFVELIQYKVEIDYDKELNKPKKILADFAPKFIEKLYNLSSQEQKKAAQIILDCLTEKHILMYFKDSGLENFVGSEGWGGELLSSDHDYVSVVSSNINGFKTDRVIKEAIKHRAEIQNDGSIIDTLTIVRQHEGGDLEYDWWNRVNANYLRVYVPLGSELISAEGQSLESYSPPIDYSESGFKEDVLVSSIEDNTMLDDSGTEIFNESGKTVFGNWVYVSPGERVVVTYKYRLPFKINLTKSTDSYSLLAQKQSGSLGSIFSHTLEYPNSWQVSWQYPESLRLGNGTIDYVGDLVKDRFLGMTFSF
jgi:hypothetical protein